MKKLLALSALSLGIAGVALWGDTTEDQPDSWDYKVINSHTSDKGLFMFHTAADVSSEEEVRDLLKKIQSDYQEEMDPAQSMFVMVDDLEGHLVSQSQIALDEVGKIHTSLDELFKWDVMMY